MLFARLEAALTIAHCRVEVGSAKDRDLHTLDLNLEKRIKLYETNIGSVSIIMR